MDLSHRSEPTGTTDHPQLQQSNSSSSPVRGPGMSPSEPIVRRILKEVYHFQGWRIQVTKSPILPSHCYCSSGSVSVAKTNSTLLENDPSGNVGPLPSPKYSEPGTLCQVCRFSNELPLHHLPEMVFPDNELQLTYEPTGFTMSFNALDAMKLISTSSPPVHVYYSNEWKASKLESGLPVNESNLDPYDWTYSTEYKGTIDESVDITRGPEIQLNLDKLREQEKILFYEEIPLYEDELHDNGISTLTVKLRVMPSGFFILLRHFLRVDNVLGKLCDTRIHFESGHDYFIRQYQVREDNYENLSHVQPHLFTDPNTLYPHLPITNEITERVNLRLTSNTNSTS